MSDRDVILKALLDFCRSQDAPVRLWALAPDDIGRLAGVATRAVDRGPVVHGHYAELTMYTAVCGACKARWESDEHVAWTDKDGALAIAHASGWALQHDGHLLCWACRRTDPKGDMYDPEQFPVGTPAEAQACAARSGVGEFPDEPTDFDECRAELKGGNR